MKTQYLITKREPCTALSVDEHMDRYCGQCQGRGYVESRVDLVDVLRAVTVPFRAGGSMVVQARALQDAEIGEVHGRQ